MHYTTVGIFLAAGFSTLGIGLAGIFNNSNIVLAASENLAPAINMTASRGTDGPDAIDYSRPQGYTMNSGGPLSTAPGSEDAEIENRLKLINSTGDPAFIPSMWAHMGKINNEFGFRRSPFGGRTYEFHAGMDIDGERGDLVVAPANGVVTEAGWQGGYGNMIEIDHGNGLKTRYGHLSRVDVNVGDRITRGQLMAFVGSTGRSTGPHLHYELRLDDKPINPRRFLPPEVKELAKLRG